MIKKVYISSVLDNLVFDVMSEFTDVEIIDSEGLGISEVANYHRTTLFDSKKIRCFLNLDTIETEDLSKLLDAGIKRDVIWCFAKISKVSKFYKRLQGVCSVQTCEGLEVYKDKKKFISEALKKYSLDKSYLDGLLRSTSDNKLLTIKDIESLAYIVNVIKDESLLSYNTYTSNSDIFKLIDAILTVNFEEFYFYFNKLESSLVPLQLHSLLLAKLRSLIFFAQDLDDLGNKSWRTYDLYNTKSQAKKVGLSNLLKVYLYYDSVLGDFYSEKPLITRICDCMFHIRDICNS
jgi:hypothetical protein